MNIRSSKKMIKVIKKVRAMQKLADLLRREGKTIGLVPTMGALHDGHLSLIKKCVKASDVTVLSVFVNRLQFGPKEDFGNYPRQFAMDKKLAADNGVDYIFAPSHEDFYNSDFSSFVDVEGVTKNLCGSARPGHFIGVATAVTKLFTAIKPHKAFFGEKDFQQFVTIKKLVADLNIDVKIYSGKIIREKNGLALSSRNAYLSDDERERALVLYRSLVEAKRLFIAGEKNALKIINNAVNSIESQEIEIDYVKIVDINSLADIKRIGEKALMAIAAKVGKTRLIDNIVLK